MLSIETGMLAVALLLAFLHPGLGSGWFEALERRVSRLARRRTLAVLLIGLTALSLRAAMLPVEPIPEPVVHDEFGYLLAANTFAHGRLTNPTPPMWEHFETFSILMKPTYQCFAQPGQGMTLALGKVLFGHPFWGVWLSCGLMCAAITWMLQGWIAPAWALLGGLLAILRYGVFGYWADSYWGGAVAAIGGALVLGALPRIKESHRARDAIMMGVGLALLANTRPYEGLVFGLPIAVVLFARMFGKKRPPIAVRLGRVVAPLTLVLAITAAGVGYYFWRVTGSPVRMPYEINRETYAVAPYMLWQHVRPEPAYRHAVIRRMYVDEELKHGYEFFRSFPGLLMKVYLGWSFFLGPALTFPLLTLVFVLPRNLSWRDIRSPTRMLLAFFGVSVIGWALESFYTAHYSAPATGLILIFVLLAMQQLRQSGPRGLFLARAVPVICVLSFGARALALPMHIPLREYLAFAWYQSPAPGTGRAAVKKHLEAMPGKQLVIVHYKPDHEPFEEWVYNDADIVNSKVVWAREMDPAEDQRLIDYFKGRNVWLLKADKKPPRLTRYTELPSRPASLSNPQTPAEVKR
jgi:hypothetical protein